MPYGVSTSIWNRLPPEDQAAIKAGWEAVHASASTPAPPPQPSAQPHPVQPINSQPAARTPVVRTGAYIDTGTQLIPASALAPPARPQPTTQTPRTRTTQVASGKNTNDDIGGVSASRAIAIATSYGVASPATHQNTAKPGASHPSSPGRGNRTHPRFNSSALAAASRIRTPEQFAIVLLSYMRLPVTPANVKGLLDWESSEGSAFPSHANDFTGGRPGLSGYHNPLNTGFLYAGKGPKTPGASRPNGAAAAYPSWRMGIQATAYTLTEPQYSGILAVLRSSRGPAALETAVLSSNWGTKIWSTAPLPPYTYSPPH